ncbi:hypothetical protein ACFP4F_19340 [Streptomyces ochraceiscleroticus]|uniref:Uncharacterized protein n=1 Tax=Streptomyces ochraceiscleroticus TaxID=47761 RepID=A0ABW1MLU7_9ACTN
MGGEPALDAAKAPLDRSAATRNGRDAQGRCGTGYVLRSRSALGVAAAAALTRRLLVILGVRLLRPLLRVARL